MTMLATCLVPFLLLDDDEDVVVVVDVVDIDSKNGINFTFGRPIPVFEFSTLLLVDTSLTAFSCLSINMIEEYAASPYIIPAILHCCVVNVVYNMLCSCFVASVSTPCPLGTKAGFLRLRPACLLCDVYCTHDSLRTKFLTKIVEQAKATTKEAWQGSTKTPLTNECGSMIDKLHQDGLIF